MVNGVTNNWSLPEVTGAGAVPGKSAAGAAGASSFADTLKQSIEEVARLQADASQAVENLAVGRTDDVTGVMMAMEKSDLAFKTLLAIRAKLMDAYEEVKSMQI
jgi:flagellar hook-basal body complex protein FliE